LNIAKPSFHRRWVSLHSTHPTPPLVSLRSPILWPSEASGEIRGRTQSRRLGSSRVAGRAWLQQFRRAIDSGATKAVVHKALDVGITLFDNADTYGERGGAEEYLGRILGPRRKHIVLVTKFGRPMDVAGKP
jgi:hypothetical protein